MISGYSAKAMGSLTQTQVSFLSALPKAELHAHLNGSIPLSVLQSLAQKQTSVLPSSDAILKLQQGVELNEIHDFFDLFPAIYALTSTPAALAEATKAVLAQFLDGDQPQCTYLELRSTPRTTSSMSRLAYVQVVLDEIERYPVEKAAYILSLNRKMDDAVMLECISIAIKMKEEGRRIVGIDLCGDPMARDVDEFAPHFAKAKAAGLGLTLHIAETSANPAQETLKLLSYKPNRLGHATFLNQEAKDLVLQDPKLCIEICLSSNLLCKTVASLEDHHIGYYLQNNHPIAICTDDTLPFRNSLLGEYALLMAKPPLGLGLNEAEIARIADWSVKSRLPL
ncbi:Metallo-dependent hydrolase [Mycena floridula]|nr:Metallo-dependent hydrolase [Mycena floridula]